MVLEFRFATKSEAPEERHRLRKMIGKLQRPPEERYCHRFRERENVLSSGKAT